MLVLRGVLCVAVMTWLFAGLSAEAGMQKKLAPLAPRSVTLGADYSQLKIAPPATGLYLGQYEWQPGDIATMEAAAGMHTTHYAANRGHWSIGYDGAGNPHLDLAQANANWNGTHGNTTGASSGTGGQVSNAGALTFPAPSANWGSVTHFAILDATSGGNMLIYGALTTAKTVNNGDPAPSFQAAALTVTFA